MVNCGGRDFFLEALIKMGFLQNEDDACTVRLTRQKRAGACCSTMGWDLLGTNRKGFSD